MAQSGLAASTGAPIAVAQTEDGPVSVVSLDYLEKLADAKKQQAADLAAQASAVQKQSDDCRAKAGWQLVTHATEWHAQDRNERVEAASGMGQLVLKLQQQIADLSARPHQGIGGILHRVTDAHELDGLKKQLQSAAAELDNRYRDVASDVEPPTGIADADQLLLQAQALQTSASNLVTEKDTVSADLQRLTSEIDKRKQVEKSLGFDALGIEADLSINGIRAVSTALVLKPKEVAALDVPATLCRFVTRTQYVGGSQGVSIPLGHGFRYRVSSYRGHPVQSQYLARVDTGQLVVTNQRLVFLGSKRDVSVPIAKLIHLEPYSDAVGIGREGKESRDVYMVQRPAMLLLYLQWVLNHQA